MRISYNQFRDPCGNTFIGNIQLPEFSSKHSYDRHHVDIPNHAHDKVYKRKKTQTHIQRKKKIVENVWNISEEMKEEFPLLVQPHRLNKLKVHCSCPICSQKTRTDGWKHSDKVKLEKGREE